MLTVRQLMDTLITMTNEYPDYFNLDVFVLLGDNKQAFVLEPSMISTFYDSECASEPMVGIHLADTFTDLCVMQAEGKTRN